MAEIIPLVVYIIVFLYSVILHEIAHGWVANRFGDDTAKISGRLSLNPLVHIDPIGSILLPFMLYFSTGFAFGYAKPVPVNPYRLRDGQRAYRLVSAAGIVTNLLLAFIAALVYKITTQYFGLDVTNAGVLFFQIAFVLNVVLGVFNALPFPGFDGFNFLTTFPAFASLIQRTPLGNPILLAQWGIFISFGLLLLFWPLIQRLLSFILTTVSVLFGI